jgi:hypothetical protein
MQTEDPRVTAAINDDAYQYAADGSKVYLNALVETPTPVEVPVPSFSNGYAKYEALHPALSDNNVAAYRTFLKDTSTFKSNPTPSVSVPAPLVESLGTIPFNQDEMQKYIEVLHKERRELLDVLLVQTKPQPEPQPKYKPWGLGDVFQELMDRELDIESLYVKAVSMGVPPQVMEFVQGQIEYKSQSRMYLASILNFIANSSVAGSDSGTANG